MENEKFEEMITEAKEKHGQIYPVALKESLSDCITYLHGVPVLWFNDTEGSTHVVFGNEKGDSE